MHTITMSNTSIQQFPFFVNLKGKKRIKRKDFADHRQLIPIEPVIRCFDQYYRAKASLGTFEELQHLTPCSDDTQLLMMSQIGDGPPVRICQKH